MRIKHPSLHSGKPVTALVEEYDWGWHISALEKPGKSCWVWMRFSDNSVKLGSWVHNRFNQTIGSHTVEPTHWAYVLEPIYEC